MNFLYAFDLFETWLISMPVLFVIGTILIAILNQAKKLEKWGWDLSNSFMILLLIAVVWPFFLFCGLSYGIWLLINLIVKPVVKLIEDKPEKIIPHEVKMLSGAELDSLLTEEFEEKMGWNNKN